MAELSLKERLQPSLLDRLRDDDPSTTVEPPSARVLSLSELRQSVQRDVGWLFNACNSESAFAGYDEARRSVLNFGIPDLAGFTVSSLDVGLLERTIEDALEIFEPRLLKNSVHVHALIDEQHMSHNTLVVHIECDLWANPTPLELLLRTELDFESGTVSVTEANK